MGSVFGSHLESGMERGNSEYGKTRMNVQERSEGDGMENVPATETSTAHGENFTKISVPKSSRTHLNGFSGPTEKRKEPKFVPYEPYKAAVSPLIPSGKDHSSRRYVEKHLIDPSLVKPLASKVIKESSMTTSHISRNVPSVPKSVVEQENCANSCTEKQDLQPSWQQEKDLLENTIQKLRTEKQELEAQFDIQTKVNADLKKLLVASLGEDMEVKVQCMSEDKAKLGEHVLLYSRKLIENNEELEKMAVECDVWKNKYEASSLLVGELAGWKTVLSRKFNEGRQAIASLLKERRELRRQLISIFCTLHSMQGAFDPSAEHNSPCSDNPWNMIQLASATRCLSEDIQFRLLGSTTVVKKDEKPENFSGLTQGEVLAHKVMDAMGNVSSLVKSEAAQNAGKKCGSHACSVLPHICSAETTLNCCKQCSGEIKML